MLKKETILSILLIIILLAIPIYATRYFSYQFKEDITLICPDCDYWISCESNSMYPTIKSCNDTLIAIEPNSRKDIKVGDIIWYRGKESQTEQYTDGTEYIYHRVKEIDYKGCYKTQGDNNQEVDDYTLCFYDIEFKVVGIIYE